MANNFSARCPPLDEVRDYSYWVGESPADVREAVIQHGGWNVVFPKKVPDWANSIRNYFNVTPRRLKFLGPFGKFRAPDIQKVGYWGSTGSMASLMALSGDVYTDEAGHYWFEMDTGGTGYHYKGGRTSKAGAIISHLTPQAFIPIFKLISPDGTGGSWEVCIHNWQRGIISRGKKRIGATDKTVDVSTRIVIDKHYQGSYNYAETVVMGYSAHKLRDVKPHEVMKLGYRDPSRWASFAKRSFPKAN